MDRMVDLHIRLSEDDVSRLQDKVADGKYRSMSEAAADLVKKGLTRKPRALRELPTANSKQELLRMVAEARQTKRSEWTPADTKRLMSRAKAGRRKRASP